MYLAAEVSGRAKARQGMSPPADPAAAARRAPWARWDGLTAVVRSAWFAYGTMLLLQVHRMWGVWRFRELTGGDTCSYFVSAYRWYRGLETNFAWSPLYTAFYGSMLGVSRDVAVATALHRLVIAVTATLLVLAVMRRLLSAELAWLIAAWWAVMPINFDTMYEVHLFAVIPILIAWLVVLRGRGPWARGWALAILVLSAFLVRNEMLFAAAAFGAVCFLWEARARRRGCGTTRAGMASLAAAYAVPMTLALLAIGFFYQRSFLKGPELWHVLDDKHSVNMGQVYAFGYQQRHRHWRGDPWTNYQPLIRRDFRTVRPTLWKMIRRNPLAMARHVLWNLRLTPSGMQLMLFDATSGTVTPDYVKAHLGELYPVPLSIAALLLLGCGLVFLRRERAFWWDSLIGPRTVGWLFILCVVAAVVLVVIPTQRPRPSYLFALTAFLMAVLGSCAVMVFSRWGWLRRLRPAMAAVMPAFVLLVPSFYAIPRPRRSLPIRDAYERLKPYQSLLADERAVFVGVRPVEMQNYLGDGLPKVYGYELFAKMGPSQSLSDFLTDERVTVLELDGDEYRRLESERPGFINDLVNGHGWRIVAARHRARIKWLLLARGGGS